MPTPLPCITMTYAGPWNVQLTYFKESGKYYSEGIYQSSQLHLWEIWDEVRELMKAGKLPGLVDGARMKFVLVDVPDHPHRHLHLLIGEKET